MKNILLQWDIAKNKLCRMTNVAKSSQNQLLFGNNANDTNMQLKHQTLFILWSRFFLPGSAKPVRVYDQLSWVQYVSVVCASSVTLLCSAILFTFNWRPNCFAMRKTCSSNYLEELTNIAEKIAVDKHNVHFQMYLPPWFDRDKFERFVLNDAYLNQHSVH